jgi:hypothetical protein
MLTFMRYLFLWTKLLWSRYKITPTTDWNI